MIKQILSSNNYTKFVMAIFNRQVIRSQWLEASMKRYGFAWFFPIITKRLANGKLEIIFGHHRFEVAKRLNLPIHYVEVSGEINVYDFERATRNWEMADYLQSHVRSGKEVYTRIVTYCSETGISLNAAIAMLAGESASSTNRAEAFKQGVLRLGNPRHSEIVGDIVVHCKNSGIPWANNSSFVQAISKVAWAQGFDLTRLKTKIAKFHHLMAKQPSKQLYIELLDSIFNHGVKTEDRVPLSHNAEVAARQRNFATKEKPPRR